MANAYDDNGVRVDGLSKQSMRAITEVCKFTTATAVQDQTLLHITKGVDVLARAKTDPKTVGFTPEHRVVDEEPGDEERRRVRVDRLADERIGESNSRGSEPVVDHEYGAQVVFEGRTSGPKKRLRENSDFLVATPGG